MKIEEHNNLVDKAKGKKDGVYSQSPYMYAVKNGMFIAYADYSGNVFSVNGVFHTNIGKVERYDRKNALLKYIIVK